MNLVVYIIRYVIDFPSITTALCDILNYILGKTSEVLVH